MVADYTFNSEALYDAVNDVVVEGAVGGKLVSVFNGTALPIFDLNGNPIPEITSNASGQTILFRANVYRGLVQFGSVAVGVTAIEVADFAVNAQAAIATANQAQVDAATALDTINDFISGQGGGYLPSTATLEDIANGTTRLAMTLAERTKLQTVATGATALSLGTTSTTAKAGDYSPTPSAIGAVTNASGVDRIWGRTVAQGFPTGAEGAADGDWLVMDAN
jgi:hypothetical protein